MAWQIRFEDSVEKQLKKLGANASKQIMTYLKKIISYENPMQQADQLKGNLAGLYKFRSGDYRIICSIIEKEITIVVVDVGHRRNIYKD